LYTISKDKDKYMITANKTEEPASSVASVKKKKFPFNLF
jgi:hypothetical protein